MSPRSRLHRISVTHFGDAIAQVGLARQDDRLSRLSAALRNHAEALNIQPPHVESLRTLDPIDDTQIAALRQATAIARIAEQTAASPSKSIRHLLHAVPHTVEVTASVAARARSEIIGGQWLHPAGTGASPAGGSGSSQAAGVRALARTWQPTTAFDDVPLATELRRASRDAERLHAHLPTQTPRTAQQALADLADGPRRHGIIRRPEPGTSL